MMAGGKDGVGAELKDKNIVVRYEHLAATAKRTRAALHHEAVDSLCHDLVSAHEELHDEIQPILSAEAFLYQADATTADVLDAKKHVSKLNHVSMVCSDVKDCAGADGNVDVEALAARCPGHTTMMNLQDVNEGTADETYKLMLHEYDSIQAPTWERRCAENNPNRVSFFNTCTDKGGDNVGAWKRVADYVKEAKLIMFTCIWCLHHQGHLADKALLVVCEEHKWNAAWPVKYFTGTSKFSTTWRTPGVKFKIRNKTSDTFPNDLNAMRAVSKVPGRCLRERWGSIDGVEQILLKAFFILFVVLPMLFARELAGDHGEVVEGRGRGRGGRGGRGRRGRAAVPPGPGGDGDKALKE